MSETNNSEGQVITFNKPNKFKFFKGKFFDFFKKFLLVAVTVAITVLLCFKYELISANGNLYRLNRITGNVQRVTGSRMVPIDKISDTDKYGLTKLRELNHIVIQDGTQCELSILWRDNQLYYKFKVSPYSGKVKKAREDLSRAGEKEFTIQLYGVYGFLIAEIPVNIHKMTSVVDNEGNVEFLVQKGKIDLTYDEAKIIGSWSASWNF